MKILFPYKKTIYIYKIAGVQTIFIKKRMFKERERRQNPYKIVTNSNYVILSAFCWPSLKAFVATSGWTFI